MNALTEMAGNMSKEQVMLQYENAGQQVAADLSKVQYRVFRAISPRK
jgi:hypothetical protein